MDIGMLGVYILLVCGAVMMLGALIYLVYYKVLQVTYWLLTDGLDWSFENVMIVLWCLLVMIGVSLIIGDAIYIMWV